MRKVFWVVYSCLLVTSFQLASADVNDDTRVINRVQENFADQAVPDTYKNIPAVYYSLEGGYIIENYGTYQAGDEVLDSGMHIPNCETDCPDALGCIVENKIEAWVAPVSIQDTRNYPNPFNPETTISFALASASHVNLSIYNVLGQEVMVLLDETIPAGTHQVNWNGKNANGESLSSGIYFCRIITNDDIVTRKTMMLK